MPIYTKVFEDYFDRAQAITTTPGFNGWTIKDTSSAGTPTYLCVSNVGLVMTLAADSEAEIVTLYQNNVLPWTLAQVEWFEFIMSVSGVDSATTIVAGLASAQHDTSDTVTTNAWFRIEGSASTSALVVETDDNVTNTDDVATGATLAAVNKRLLIDLSQGLSTPRFFVDGAKVGGSTLTLAGAASTTGVQPYIQLQKASGTGVPAVTVRGVRAGIRFNV